MTGRAGRSRWPCGEEDPGDTISRSHGATEKIEGCDGALGSLGQPWLGRQMAGVDPSLEGA